MTEKAMTLTERCEALEKDVAALTKIGKQAQAAPPPTPLADALYALVTKWIADESNYRWVHTKARHLQGKNVGPLTELVEALKAAAPKG